MAGIVDVTTADVYCGGTIISNRYVITAAHCLLRKSPGVLGVLVGDHNISSGLDTAASALYRVEAYEIHPRFVQAEQGYDIAIVRTETIIQFSLYVGPACLPFRYSTFDFYGQLVTLLGWGLLEFSGQKADVLQKANVNVVTNGECSSGNPDKTILSEQICTFARGKDACQYDSGGLLVVELRL
ncbi:unnamed protein product [Acanthoscelides obtectus]|nr:unnamed protein product [Acanthoscelides obtectus]CAK1674243.1 hypothetical protein AOBTE_LOCUS29563 [Acanthoscelides obtectus]